MYKLQSGKGYRNLRLKSYISKNVINYNRMRDLFTILALYAATTTHVIIFIAALKC